MPRSFQYKNLMTSKHPCVTLLKSDVNARNSIPVLFRTNNLRKMFTIIRG
jgi:hypothetical protein